MSAASDTSSDPGYDDLNKYHEPDFDEASSPSPVEGVAAGSRQPYVDVTMNVQTQGPTGPEELSKIRNWIQQTVHERPGQSQTQSHSDDRVIFSVAVPPNITNNPQAWEELGSNAPEIVRSARVEITRPVEPYELEDTSTSTSRQLGDLVQSLNNTERLNDDLTRSGRYDKVSVLPIMFRAVEQDLGLEAELESLRTCLSKQFNFTVYPIFKIPDKRAYSELTKKMEELIRQHGKKAELIIVVYAGHGFNPEDIDAGQSTSGPAIWIPQQYSVPEAGVDWSKIQPLLHQAPCDTLTILNCCFAGNAALGSMRGTNEILAASDRESMAYTYTRSFLKALVEVLTEFGTSKFTINKLRDRLDAYNKIERGHTRITCPYHKRYPSFDHPSIQLQPLPKLGGASRRFVESSQRLPDPSFYVKITLDGSETVSKTEWTSFFTSASYPSAVKLHFYTEESMRNELKR
ncbi:hypothetical protein LTR93_001083 [Exophiala xenobiotica]|nr:hypothetical protein LTR93_001083 [Exophiala xenobiotica]